MAHTDATSRLHILLLKRRERRSARESGEAWDEDDSDREHRIENIRAKRRHQNDGEKNRRERKEQLHEAHKHHVHQAAAVCREHPDDCAAREPTPTAKSATFTEICAAKIVRERTSRPSSSVPSQCALDGPSSMTATSRSYGE